MEHFTRDEWVDLCEACGNKCLACGQTEDLSPDHVVPLACGGSNVIENIQPLCFVCNTNKGVQGIDYRVTPPFHFLVQTISDAKGLRAWNGSRLENGKRKVMKSICIHPDLLTAISRKKMTLSEFVDRAVREKLWSGNLVFDHAIYRKTREFYPADMDIERATRLGPKLGPDGRKMGKK